MWFSLWTVVIKLSHRHIGSNADALTSNTPEPARRTFIRVRLWDLDHNTMNKHQIPLKYFICIKPDMIIFIQIRWTSGSNSPMVQFYESQESRCLYTRNQFDNWIVIGCLFLSLYSAGLLIVFCSGGYSEGLMCVYKALLNFKPS